MSRLDNLADKYERHITAPWQKNLSGAERVIFVVYPKEDELILRLRVDDFAQRTRTAGHSWAHLDLTNWFPEWLCSQEYVEEYLQHPEDLELKLVSFTEHCAAQIRKVLEDSELDDSSVVALSGIGSIYGRTDLAISGLGFIVSNIS